MRKINRTIFMFLLVSFFSSSLSAKMYLDFLEIDKKISLNECVNTAKKARADLFDDSFGEHVIDNSYFYQMNDVIILVMCFEKKDLVFLSVSTQDLDPSDYLDVFAEHFGMKTKVDIPE